MPWPFRSGRRRPVARRPSHRCRARLWLVALEDRITPTVPNPPVIIEPFNEGQVTSVFDMNMQTDPGQYFDPDGHAWQSTQWEVRAVGTGQAVWQTSFLSAPPLTLYRVDFSDGAFVGALAGQTQLGYNTNYALRVRYRDGNNEVSADAIRNFRTQAATEPVPGAGTWIARQGYVVEQVATGFRLPVNVAFLPNPGPNPTDPLYYVVELYGSIKVVRRNGTVGTFASGLLDYNPQGPISGTGEQGLTGIAVEQLTGGVVNLYVGMLWDNGAPPGPPNHFPKVERLSSTDGGLTMASRTLLLNMQPETQGQSHIISNITIGPDGKLYVHMGDGFNSATALNLAQYRGKVLRMNKDGTAPTDNPFYNAADGITARDYVFTYGHRNPFGGAWRAANGRHYVVENGNSLDRLTDLVAGQSYGWAGNDSALQTFSKYVWNPATAPVNIDFVEVTKFGGSGFPMSAWGSAFVSLSGPTYAAGTQARSKSIEQFADLDTLNPQGKLAVAPSTLVKYNGTGRASVAGLAAGPDGLYFTDLYEDTGSGGATGPGANVYRVRYVGDIGGLPPTVATPASANPNPVTGGTTSTLTVLGADDGGEPALTYTWGVQGSPPGGVSFSANGTNAAKTTVATFSANGTYNLFVVIRDIGGQAAISNVAVTVTSIVTGTGTGLAATYYDNSNFTGATFSRVDPVINFNWGTGAPAPGIGADTFSVRWTGQVQPRYTGTYTILTTTDDGVRLRVNNQLIIDRFIDQGPTTHTGTIALAAGQLYPVSMEYYDNTGGAVAMLEWLSASQPREVVPRTQLYPASAIPAVPFNLTAVPLGGTVVRLAWVTNEVPTGRAESYAIEGSTDGTTFTQVATAPAGATGYVVGGLSLTTAYQFRVRAVNILGNSAPSNTAGGMTTGVASDLNYPTSFATGTAGVLAFNGGAAVLGGRLRLTDAGGQARSIFSTTLQTVTRFTTTFTFQLTNAQADGFTFTIQGVGPTALGAPGGALGYEGIAASLAVKFDLFNNIGEGTNSTGVYTNGVAPFLPADNINPPIDLHSGRVHRATIAYDSSNLFLTITDTVSGLTYSKTYPNINLPALVGGQAAYVGFTAGTGGQAATQEILTWTYTPIVPPSAPQNLTASAQSGRVTLNWAASAGAVTYNVHRGTSSNGQGMTPLATGVTINTFTDTTVTNGTTYYYKVSGVNTAGEGPRSAEVSVTPLPALRVASVVVNASPNAEFQAQRSLVTSLTVTFSGLVGLPGVPANAFRLTRTGPGGPTGDVTLAVDLTGSTPTQTVARLTFSGSLTEGLANSLVDGLYSLTVFGAQVQGNGQPLDGDGDGSAGGDYTSPDSIKLFRLFGDVNGDKTINGLDLGIFRDAFGTTVGHPNFRDYLDQNGDGAINGLDLGQFRFRFGMTLP